MPRRDSEPDKVIFNIYNIYCAIIEPRLGKIVPGTFFLPGGIREWWPGAAHCSYKPHYDLQVGVILCQHYYQNGRWGGGVAKEGSRLFHHHYLLVIGEGAYILDTDRKGWGMILSLGRGHTFPSQTKIGGMVHLHLLVIWEGTYILDTDRDEWGIVHLLLVIGKGAYIPLTHIDGWGMVHLHLLVIGEGAYILYTDREGWFAAHHPVQRVHHLLLLGPDLSVFLVEVQHHQAILGLGCGLHAVSYGLRDVTKQSRQRERFKAII